MNLEVIDNGAVRRMTSEEIRRYIAARRRHLLRKRRAEVLAELAHMETCSEKLKVQLEGMLKQSNLEYNVFLFMVMLFPVSMLFLAVWIFLH